MSKIACIASFTLGLLLPGLAAAWTPYPYAYPPTFGPGYDRPAYAPPSRPAGLRVTREADQDAYHLNIEVTGTQPQDVQVRTEGRWILISLDRSAEETRQDTDSYPDPMSPSGPGPYERGGYYMRSYQMSSSRMNRRLTLPRDADAEAMTREDGEHQVRITIPRRRY